MLVREGVSRGDEGTRDEGQIAVDILFCHFFRSYLINNKIYLLEKNIATEINESREEIF